MEIREQELLHRVVEALGEYRNGKKGEPEPVLEYHDPESLRRKIDLTISKEGIPFERLLDMVRDYLKYSVDTGNPQFCNQLFAGFNYPAFLGEVITGFTNTSMYTYEVSPLATLMEIELGKKMSAMAGYPDGEGLFLTGGSNSNLIALLLARYRARPDAKQAGLSGEKPLSFFVSDQAHYSFNHAAHMLGIGIDRAIKVKSDGNGRMRSDTLDEAIEESIDRGEEPFFVGMTMGTTMLGAYDPIPEIAPVARKYGLWLHADGSWGGSVLLSGKHRRLLDGLEETDSFGWNPHKMMNIPLICSTLLIKEKNAVLESIPVTDADYLFHENERQRYDRGELSIQCGRRVDSLKLWLAWKYYGDSGYEQRIDRLFEIAAYFEGRAESEERISTLVPRQSLSVCFQYQPKNGADAGEFSIKLRERMLHSGKALVNYGFVNGQAAIRFVAVNPDMTEADIDRFFDNLSAAAAELEQNN